MDLRQLKHKYSHGPIPQWELDRLAGGKPAKPETPEFSGEVSKPRRGRPPKSAQAVNDGDSHTDRD